MDRRNIGTFLGKESGKRQILFILVLFLLFNAITRGQEKDSQSSDEQKLKAEILAVFKSKGEEGLRDFVKTNKTRIENKFIVNLSLSSVKKRNEEWLKISEIMAEEKKDEKTLADVLYNRGEYYYLTSDYKKAVFYFEKALTIYAKINDSVGQGNVYEKRGLIYFFIGENVNALKTFNNALLFFEEAENLIGQGNVYLRKGEMYYYTGLNIKAHEMFDKALSFFIKAEAPVGQGNVHLRKGNIHFYMGNNSRALKMYDKALPLFEKGGDLLGQANVCFSKGDIYFYTGDNSKALEMFEKALICYNKLGNLHGQGNVHLRKGNIYFYTGDYSKAQEMYNIALTYYEISEDKGGKGNIYQSKGDIYLRIGDYSKAQEMYSLALVFYEKVEDPVGQGNIYHDKGNIYLMTKDYSRALEMYEKSLLFYKKVGEPLGLGNAYWRKGDIYFYKGDYSNALEMYEKALIFFNKSANPIGQGNVYRNKGDIYLRTGCNSNANDMYNKALSFFEKADDPLGKSNVYLVKGDFYLMNGDNSRAMTMYEKAMIFFEKIGNPLGQGHVYLRKGDINSRIGDKSRAIENYEKALALYKKAKDLLGQSGVYRNKGDVYFDKGRYTKALEMYEKSLTLFTKIRAIESEAYTLHGKARIFAKFGEKDNALFFFEKGISRLEKLRGQIPLSKMKRTFLEKVYKQYEETVFFMLENKYCDKGFTYAESLKTRVFLDRLAEGLVKLDKGIIPNLKQRKDNFVSKLSIISKEMNEVAGKNDEKKLKELKDQYKKVESEFEELLIKIRLKNPLYASIQYPEPVSVQDLQDTVLEEGELLLRYFIAKDKIYVFLISKKDFKVITLKDTAKYVNEIVEQYLISVEENNPRRMKEYGKTLYKKLVKPLETWIKNREEIIIVPDRELATIPFESFIINEKSSRKPVYLLEKYRIKYIQSASALAILRKYYQRQGTSKHFIGFGDPVYDYKNFKQGKPEKGSFADSPLKGDEISQIHRSRYQREGGVSNRLQGSGEEVQTIAELFKKHTQKCVVHLREQANESNAKLPGIKEFDYIHFSCHGILGDGFQGLVLSQIPGSPEDGYLTLNEIMNCDYHAKLVVLSACRTGKGKMERAEGVSGLTRAVMYAGTPAVIASLWDVDDKATKELMVRFYQYMLEENLSKEEALRKAKLDLIKGKKYASPVYWSGFVMYGE